MDVQHICSGSHRGPTLLWGSYVARWKYLRIQIDTMSVAPVPVHEYLKFKERLIDRPGRDDPWTLEYALALD